MNEVHLLELNPTYRPVGVALIPAYRFTIASMSRISTISRGATPSPSSVYLSNQIGKQHHLRAILPRVNWTAGFKPTTRIIPRVSTTEMLKTKDHLGITFLPSRKQRVGIVTPRQRTGIT